MKVFLLIFIFVLQTELVLASGKRPTMIEQRMQAYGIGDRESKPELIKQTREVEISDVIEPDVPHTEPLICVEASDLKEAYYKAEQKVHNQVVTGSVRVSSINGDTSSSENVVVNKHLTLISQKEAEYCFKDTSGNIILTEKIQTPLASNKDRVFTKFFSEEFEDFHNANFYKFIDPKYLTVNTDKNAKYMIQYYIPRGELEDYKRDVNKKYRVGLRVSNETNRDLWDYERQILPKYDCNGKYPYKSRVYEKPSMDSIYLDITVHIYGEESLRVKYYIYKDGTYTPYLGIPKQSLIYECYAQNAHIKHIQNLNIIGLEVKFGVESTTEQKPLTKEEWKKYDLGECSK